MSASKTARVEQPSATKPPFLTPGDITPEALRSWEVGCRQYFKHKAVPGEEQVGKVAWGMQEPSIQDWYINDQERMDKLTFVEYMKEVRAYWLPTDWADITRQKLLSSCQDSKAFHDWAVEVQRLNSLLRGTESHLTEINLRYHLEAHMQPDLRTEYRAENVAAITAFRPWIEKIRTLDEKRLRILASQKEAVEVGLRAERARNGGDKKLSSSSRYNAKSGQNTSGKTGAFVRVPPLTEDERTLLRDNDGCFKCREPFAKHTTANCTNGFPDGATYKTITASTIAAKKAAKAAKKNGNTVAAVEVANTVAVVMPSAALGNGSDSDECVAPLTTPLLLWDCFVDGPASVSPTRVSALIDDGSAAVLIDEEFALKLGLRQRKLPAPIPFNVALSGDSKETFLLSDYVKIACTSVDSRFTSRSVRAVVAPKLCTPLLLGGPFLHHNKIVIDHELRTCIAKDANYDLLNPEANLPKKSCVPSPPKMAALRHEVVRELKHILPEYKLLVDESCDPVNGVDIVAAVRQRIEILASEEQLRSRDAAIKHEFIDRFPADIPHNDSLPSDVLFRIKLKDANKVIQQRGYDCPRKYRDAWKVLLEQHVSAGRLRPSDSAHSSPAFIIPKADPTALPRWVNDYRQLNLNTVPDNHPLPRIDEILRDCAKGKVFGKIDMTNSFFQTKVHPDDMHLLAVHTPWGLYEWTVMPMGVRNAPAAHQRRMSTALRHLIGKICHVYLDDIIIWSQTLEEHEINVRKVLEALRAAHLFCSLKKTSLFNLEIDFLGHHISARGIEPDKTKIARILDWPEPRKANDVRAFLGLVRYLANHLPALADHARILTPLTTKTADLDFPIWTRAHASAFQGIKDLVTSPQCLTTIDHDNPGNNKIFLTCDASDYRTGAVLSWGETWETARPVAFDSAQLREAELNYPVHEKELLAIIRGLKKWRVELLGGPIQVYTDHRTLENFVTQKGLSRRQARWAEYLAHFDITISYLKGEENTGADALSRLQIDDDIPSTKHLTAAVTTSVLQLELDKTFLKDIITGYVDDPFCKKLTALVGSLPGLTKRDGLLFVANRLVIPRVNPLREQLFHLAHDASGHFGGDKTYAALRSSYYWPNMRRDLVESYIPSCVDCMRNKSSTTSTAGLLHPLPIPDGRGDSVAIDFIGPLPEDQGFNTIVTMTDRLNADLRIVPCRDNVSAEQFALLFFDHWYCENGLPLDIVSDRDKLFISRFWKSLHKLTGIKLKMSSSYHPQTDGSSERTNKTINQCIRFHVERNQKGWVRALPRVRFQIMNSINASTGTSPFQLHLGRSPRIIPPLARPTPNDEPEDQRARTLMTQLEHDVMEAQDNLLAAKASQATQVNKHRSPELDLRVGDKVMLSTKHRRRDYMQKNDNRVAKFMPRFDGPYTILDAHPETSTYTLDLPNSPNIFPTFHSSQLKPFHANDSALFPSRDFPRPGPVVTEDGQMETFIEKIVDEKKVGRGKRYLVRWVGFGADEDEWLPRRDLEDCEALDHWERRNNSS